MILQNERYKVAISVDEMYTVGSTDNMYYDIVLNPRKLQHYDIYKVFNIVVDNGMEVFKIALVGNFYSYSKDCALLEESILTILQNNVISQIDLQSKSLLLYKDFECMGCNYGIYKTNEGYIIYGEIEIIMLDWDFCKKWSFTGRDIFVSCSAKKSFEICRDKIKLYDWEENYYEIDFSGKLLN